MKPDTDDEEEGEEKAKSESDDVFKLTGQPSEEDELLFAVPIVTAYSALSNFKYVLFSILITFFNIFFLIKC